MVSRAARTQTTALKSEVGIRSHSSMCCTTTLPPWPQDPVCLDKKICHSAWLRQMDGIVNYDSQKRGQDRIMQVQLPWTPREWRIIVLSTGVPPNGSPHNRRNQVQEMKILQQDENQRTAIASRKPCSRDIKEAEPYLHSVQCLASYRPAAVA